MAKKRKVRPEVKASQELMEWEKLLKLAGYRTSRFPGLLIWHPDPDCSDPCKVEFLIGKWVVTYPYQRHAVIYKYFAVVQKHVKAWLEGDPLGE